jgi:hypothetical protein
VATRSRGAALVLAALLADPFALFHPTVELDERERRALTRGEAISQTVPMPSRHIAVFAAVPVGVDAERVARWVEDIAAVFPAARSSLSAATCSRPATSRMAGV